MDDSRGTCISRDIVTGNDPESAFPGIEPRNQLTVGNAHELRTLVFPVQNPVRY